MFAEFTSRARGSRDDCDGVFCALLEPLLHTSAMHILDDLNPALACVAQAVASRH